jgi:DNA polymerase-1
MTEWIIDIETEGLNPSIIWCCGVKPLGAEGHLIMTQEGFNHFLSQTKGDTLVAHNGDSFDFPILRRLWGADFSHHVLVDSVKLSRLASPKRVGGNSLANWGALLGFPKGEYSDWSQFTPEMGAYCLRDLELNERVLHAVREELNQPHVLLEKRVREITDVQEKYGWLLDFRGCLSLLDTLRTRRLEVEKEVRVRFVPRAKFSRLVTPKVKASGELSVVGLKSIGDAKTVGGPFSLITFPEFNLGSRQQIGEYLQLFGWVPKTFTPTGQPQVDEGTLEGSDIPEAKLIEEYLMLEKRIAMIGSWIEEMDAEGRVHGKVDTQGAVTYRMTHSKPNMAQVTGPSKPYGKEMRQCWIVPEGYKLVGVDADALELCMLAHYMNDPLYTKAIVSGDKNDGTDIHSINQRAANLPTRDAAKTFIYAYLYGAGDEKIGSIAGLDRRGGKQLKERFLRATPALRDLKQRVEAAARRDWIKGVDGRRVEVRSIHAALNTLLQSAGAIVMKRALVIMYDMAKAEGLEFEIVGQIHDEVVAEVLEAHAPRFAQIAETAIKQAGEYYELRCPLRGTAKIGDSWYETH